MNPATPRKIKHPNRTPRKAAVPLWTPASGITNSALTLFLECREQFRLSYVEGWSPKEVSDAIEFGSIFHAFCEHYDFAARTPDTDAHPLSPKSQLDNITSLFLKQRRASNKTVSKEFLALIRLARVTFEGYIQAQPNKQFNWIAREECFNVPVQVPRSSFRLPGRTLEEAIANVPLQRLSGEYLGERYPVPLQESKGAGFRTINLRGKRDGVFVYPNKPNELWVFETKTKSRIDEDGLVASLGFNFQALLYAYVTQLQYNSTSSTSPPPVVTTAEHPRVKGILYNVIRRPGQRQKQGESDTAFISRVQAEIAKDPAHYYKRQDIQLQPNDLDHWASTVLFPVLNQLLDWWESISTPPSTPFVPISDLHYFNPNALFNMYGRCHLFNLITSGSKFLYKQRHAVFPELEE